MFRKLGRLIVALLALCGAGALAFAAWFAAQGISAKTPPGRLETAIAPKLRVMAIPRAARDAANPVPASAEVVKAGMEHFADHCAICHANDGSGDTEMGHNLYPRVPDMRLAATQNLSDGELFYIIENGVKLTGMPAWGGDKEHADTASWHLVHFIRHLPKLTEAEIKEMKRLNPKGIEERDQMDPDEFLKGGAVAPAHKHEGKGHPK